MKAAFCALSFLIVLSVTGCAASTEEDENPPADVNVAPSPSKLSTTDSRGLTRTWETAATQPTESTVCTNPLYGGSGTECSNPMHE